jgi:hypothetical protein
LLFFADVAGTGVGEGVDVDVGEVVDVDAVSVSEDFMKEC